jgi:hypothetical protein
MDILDFCGTIPFAFGLLVKGVLTFHRKWLLVTSVCLESDTRDESTVLGYSITVFVDIQVTAEVLYT